MEGCPVSKREKKILRTGKIVHRLTMLLGLLSIVLPLVFWKYIPDHVPLHFGADGRADRTGSKNEMVLLFFLIAFLLGIMSIVIYYIKTSAQSKYAKAKETESLTTIYPMLIIVDFAAVSMFAYIVFCTVTLRSLGVLFLPAVLTGVFAPIIYYIRKAAVVSRKRHEELKDYVYQEKLTKGICYRAKVDWWLGLILVGSIGIEFWIFLKKLVTAGKWDWPIFITTFLVAVLIFPMFFIRYTLYPKHLLISCAIYGRERISYQSIVSMKETHNPLSSAAPSLDRIQIDYAVNGVQKMTLISPVRKKEFLKQVEEKRNETKAEKTVAK